MELGVFAKGCPLSALVHSIMKTIQYTASESF